MIEELEVDDVRWFIRMLHSEYEKRTRLRDWCNIEPFFDEEIRQPEIGRAIINEEEENEFIQIGQWTKLPIDIIQSPWTSQHILTNMATRITNGERNYLINRLDKSANADEIPTVEGLDLDFEDFQRLSGQVRLPNHLIMPMRDDLREMRRNWREFDNYHFLNREFIVLGDSAINVIWYSPEKDEDVEGHGYLVGSDAITIQQKWHGDSPDPKAFEHDERFDKYSLNRPFMVYLGTKIDIDEEADSDSLRERTDFLYRTVLSEPDVNPNGVLQFRL